MKLSLILLLVGFVLLVGGALWLWTPDRPRAALEAKYLRSQSDFMNVLGVKLHVRDDGPRNAPAIIMIHGFGSSLHTWDGWADRLQNAYRVIRFDLPGSGLSHPDPSEIYTDHRSVQILEVLMDKLGIAAANIVGNSIGGRIAWTFAVTHPDRTAKLILISPDGFASKGFEYGRKPNVSASVQIMRFVLPKYLLRVNLQPAYGDPTKLSEATVDRYYELMLAPGSRAALIARMSQTIREDPEPLLRQIRAPVLLIWGEKDAAIPFSNASDYMRNLADARLTSFPMLGHVPQEEAPEQTSNVVREFLAR